MMLQKKNKFMPFFEPFCIIVSVILSCMISPIYLHFLVTIYSKQQILQHVSYCKIF